MGGGEKDQDSEAYPGPGRRDGAPVFLRCRYSGIKLSSGEGCSAFTEWVLNNDVIILHHGYLYGYGYRCYMDLDKDSHIPEKIRFLTRFEKVHFWGIFIILADVFPYLF